MESMQPFELSANPTDAQNDYERFCRSYNNFYKRAFEPEQSSALLPLFGNSRFLAHFIIRHPDATAVIHSPFFKKTKTTKDFSEELENLPPEELAKKLQTIRKYKYTELLRITLKDFSGCAQEIIFSELSALAQVILQHSHQLILQESLKKWNAIHPEEKPGEMAIIGMGKLGGAELNYSSDIDLIAVNENSRDHEFYVRHLQNLTCALTETTDEGFLYRVDWDLRPEGIAGPLINSLAAMEDYYQSFGADWERQAYTKARTVAGDLELGVTFLKKMEPFIYRKNIDLQTLESLKHMKQKIHRDLDAHVKNGLNIKTGKGGIREIEFFVQSFLALYGGKNAALRNRNTLETLSLLTQNSLLQTNEAQTLKEAYLFLRKCEHRLQLDNEEQTHFLSEKPEEHLKTARRMGYKNPAPDKALQLFDLDLKKHTQNVSNIFNSLFADDYPRGITKTTQADYRVLLQERLAHQKNTESFLDEMRFFKKEALLKIAELEKNSEIQRHFILQELSSVAEALCQETLNLALSECCGRYGQPVFKNDHEDSLSLIMPVAMGKLGGAEINYYSDLDLIFIYSEDGHTNGTNSITNAEFFAKVVQKMISYLSITTKGGSGYEIDTELRPSGNKGMLVTSLNSFMEYQKTVSQTWEHQALLRARPITNQPTLSRVIQNHLRAFLFSTPHPKSIAQEMNHLRMRVEKELAREQQNKIDLKKGYGSLMDIEFILQYFQLTESPENVELQTSNTFIGLEALIKLPLLPKPDCLLLKDAYTFYRTLESKIQLRLQRSTQYLFLNGDMIKNLAVDMQTTHDNLIFKINDTRENVRKIYNEVFNKLSLRGT